MSRRVVLKYLVHKHPLEARDAEAEADQARQNGDYADFLGVEAASQALGLQADTAGNCQARESGASPIFSLGLWHVFCCWKPVKRWVCTQLSGGAGGRLGGSLRHVWGVNLHRLTSRRPGLSHGPLPRRPSPNQMIQHLPGGNR